MLRIVMITLAAPPAGRVQRRNYEPLVRSQATIILIFMLLGAHLILSAYGFWLPNDPRGSWSDFVASWELLLYGKATKVSTTRSVASVPHDRALRKAAKKALIHPQVFFDGTQALTIAKGFARVAREVDLPVHACSILPTHSHLVLGAHRTPYHLLAGRLKSTATRSLREQGIDPMSGRLDGSGNPQSPWGSKLWKVYIDNETHLRQAIRYVEQNPLKEGKPVQHWSFVVP